MASTYLDERVYEPGDTIFTEGDTGTEMFIVQDGQVAVTKTVEGCEVFLTKLERGDFFGEMALLDSRPRNATCRALVRTHVVAIKSGELLIKLRRDPTFALEMLQTMSRRIRYLDDQLVNLMRREPVEDHRRPLGTDRVVEQVLEPHAGHGILLRLRRREAGQTSRCA